MISCVRGVLETRTGEYAIVNVGGLSFRIYAPTSTLREIGSIGEAVHLFTHLYVREDNLSLYGFATEDELHMFELLLTISGVGPKAATAILSAVPVPHLQIAIASGNADFLTRVPGIGRKMAGRIILELKGKVAAEGLTAPLSIVAPADADILAALTNLGYSASEAQAAIRSLPDDHTLTIEERIILALRFFTHR
ncbi:MAG: Holliday junction branch migration protein RuvA [Chloroflexi bacterium]|nr:Holliday junction branch migration protein RuvA [Chloroflexota bacterium]MCL5076462.1 Holliday junction branch migration protein RuvA [Chloroflexota bacterium]